jgi:hypothetical protein
MLLNLLDMIHGLLQLLVALIPLAIWQRTQISGFLWLAASYVLQTFSGWAGQWVFSTLEPDNVERVIVIWRLLGYAILAIAAIGLWQIYTALKQRWPAA